MNEYEIFARVEFFREFCNIMSEDVEEILGKGSSELFSTSTGEKTEYRVRIREEKCNENDKYSMILFHFPNQPFPRCCGLL